MIVNFDLIKWVSEQSIDVISKTAPMIAQLLGVDLGKVTAFIEWLKVAAKETIEAVEAFVNFPALFGATGDGLTDEFGCNHPDCPCPKEFAPVVWALKAQAA